MTELRRPPALGVLAAYTADHDTKTVEWLNSEDLRGTFGMRQAVSVGLHRNWVDAAVDTWIRAIQDREGVHVGNVLLKINERHRSGYLQIYIGETRARGMGLGNQALIATLEAAFGEHVLHRVWLHTFADNLRAEMLYKKHGFVLEGVERDALWFDGVCVSQRRWSLLEGEWRAICAKAGRL